MGPATAGSPSIPTTAAAGAVPHQRPRTPRGTTWNAASVVKLGGSPDLIGVNLALPRAMALRGVRGAGVEFGVEKIYLGVIIFVDTITNW